MPVEHSQVPSVGVVSYVVSDVATWVFRRLDAREGDDMTKKPRALLVTAAVAALVCGPFRADAAVAATVRLNTQDRTWLVEAARGAAFEVQAGNAASVKA